MFPSGTIGKVVNIVVTTFPAHAAEYEWVEEDTMAFLLVQFGSHVATFGANNQIIEPY